MKKFIVTLLVVVLSCGMLCSCSTDFSEEINGAMDGLYDSLYGALELFFKDASNKDDTSEGEDVGGDEENKDEPSPEPEVQYEIGTRVGQKLPSYSVEIFDENGVSGEFIDPSALGKVTVINFWGTWCPPCMEELPEFSEVATEYKDTVTIVAIHSVNYFSTLALSHIKNNFSDSDIIFARDVDYSQGNVHYDECYETFGGNGYYPYTIILDQNGVITYAKEGALSKSQLIEKIEIALGN